MPTETMTQSICFGPQMTEVLETQATTGRYSGSSRIALQAPRERIKIARRTHARNYHQEIRVKSAVEPAKLHNTETNRPVIIRFHSSRSVRRRWCLVQRVQQQSNGRVFWDELKCLLCRLSSLAVLSHSDVA